MATLENQDTVEAPTPNSYQEQMKSMTFEELTGLVENIRQELGTAVQVMRELQTHTLPTTDTATEDDEKVNLAGFLDSVGLALQAVGISVLLKEI